MSTARMSKQKTNSLIALGYAYATPTNWLEVERDDMIAANIKHVLDSICEVLLKRLSSMFSEPESVTLSGTCDGESRRNDHMSAINHELVTMSIALRFAGRFRV
jgi:hypothetical protein